MNNIHKRLSLLLSLIFLQIGVSRAQLYFPPKSTNTWDTLHFTRLDWCPSQVDSLYDFLASKNTKAFLVLKDGKIVLEKYFGTFTQDSLWYWASAGKSLAASVVGIAEQEGLLKLEDPVSKYLGKGWTTCPADKEDLITIRHQLTMTTGLNENLLNSDCTDPSCLTWKADAGTRWFYHNAPYTLTHDVVEAATGKSFNIYTYQQISSKIGMSGLWVKQGFNDLYISKARDMARYGLLVLGKGVWQADTVLKNRAFVQAMTETSQNLNKSYGYLWWLNGKGEIIFPGLPTVFNRNLIPSAPADLYAALGKNDQKLYIVPSQNLIVVRLGEAADEALPALSDFDDSLWITMNKLKCTTGYSNYDYTIDIAFQPNPFNNYFSLTLILGTTWQLIDLHGNVVLNGTASLDSFMVQTDKISDGFYYLTICNTNFIDVIKVAKISK